MPPKAKKVTKKQQDSGKRYLVSLRLGIDTRQKLEEAASRSGRSLAAEAEAQLDFTFRLDDRSVVDALRLNYGPFLGVLLAGGMVAEKFTTLQHTLRVQDYWKREGDLQLGEAMSRHGGPFGWLNDPVAYKKALVAANEVFELFQPINSTNEEDPFPNVNPKQARDVLRFLIMRPENAFIRTALGDLIERLPDDVAAPHPPPTPE